MTPTPSTPLRALCRAAWALAVVPALLGAEACSADPASGEAAAPSRAARPAPTEAPIEAGAPLRYPDALTDPIAATIYSLPAAYVDPDRVKALLEAVRERSPDRELVVLVDSGMERALRAEAEPLRLHLVPTGDRLFSPWPRDPFSVVEDPGGRLVLVDRPGRQPGREEDAAMAETLVRGLPDRLSRRWDEIRLERAPFPFHNGHVLMAGEAAWVSLHSLEPRILEILDMDRVPAETFGSAAGIDRYLAAADRAVEDFAKLYGKPVRLVHPLPRSGRPAERTEVMRRIGGGGPFDLDSLVTLLPGEDGGVQALVGHPEAGLRLLSGLEPEGWKALRSTYGIDGGAAAQGRPVAALLAHQTGERAVWLGRFLDLVAEHLAEQGLAVERLPLVLVPTRLLPEPERYGHENFLLGWGNVVVETRDGRTTAEGFSSGIPSADVRARETYAAAGVRLELLPTLVGSVTGNGGYRCASNQVRRRP